MEAEEPQEEDLGWRVDEGATSAEIVDDPAPLSPGPAEGRVVFRDEAGRRTRLPADLSQLSPRSRDAALQAMGNALRSGPPQNIAVMAALERLSQMRAAGKISEEQYEKERERLENY